jgi:TonB family protein
MEAMDRKPMRNQEDGSLEKNDGNRTTRRDEFKSSFRELLDTRFLTILVLSVLFHIALVSYFLLNPPTEEKEQARNAKIQKRLARDVIEREVHLDLSRKLPDLADLTDTQAEGANRKGTESAKKKEPQIAKSGNGGAAGEQVDREAARAERRQRMQSGETQKQIASVVGSKGILALLTSTGSAATGAGVADVLDRAAGKQGDLDKTISGLAGLRGAKSAGDAGGGKGSIRGGRAEEGGSIDDMVSGLGEVSSGPFGRSGDLLVSEGALVEGGGAGGAGGRDPSQIQTVVQQHSNSIQYCYQRELKRSPSLKGKIVVRFKVTPSGEVTDVEIVSSTLDNRRVEQCVVSRIRRWSDFGVVDSSVGETTVRQTYAFGY